MFVQNFDGDMKTEKPKAASECPREVKKKAVKMEKRSATPTRSSSSTEGSQSSLENRSGSRSVAYTYEASQGLGKLESATNLAQNLPESRPLTSGPQHLRSLLTMENRLSDLRINEIHTWLRQRTHIPIPRDST
jgi:hypothetical protein